MKILEFTLALPDSRSLIIKEERLPRFYPYLHRHNEIQLTWIIDGEGTLVTGNSIRHFKSNEIFWIGAKQSHVFRGGPAVQKPGRQRRTHSLDIFFSLDSPLDALLLLPEMKTAKAFIDQHQQGFKVPGSKVAIVSERMIRVRKSTGVDQLIYFMELLKMLLSIKNPEPLATEAENIRFNEEEGLRIAHIYSYVMKNYKEPITLQKAADLAHMTPQAFCRYFKKHTRGTLIEFINRVRVNEACKQLVSGKNDSIAAIAYDNGFNSITHFNRVFRKVVKKSPREYIAVYGADT